MRAPSARASRPRALRPRRRLCDQAGEFITTTLHKSPPPPLDLSHGIRGEERAVLISLFFLVIGRA